jgi:hypothetical protein
MFCKHLLVYINSKVPFHENLPPCLHIVPASLETTIRPVFLLQACDIEQKGTTEMQEKKRSYQKCVEACILTEKLEESRLGVLSIYRADDGTVGQRQQVQNGNW